MRKRTIFPVMALSALTLGTISPALPASAAMQHSLKAGEDNNDGSGTTQPTVVSGSGSGSGSGSTPSGGASTGGGGMASTGTSPNVALWLTTGGVGLALVGTGLVSRRRRALNPALAETNSSATTKP